MHFWISFISRQPCRHANQRNGETKDGICQHSLYTRLFGRHCSTKMTASLKKSWLLFWYRASVLLSGNLFPLRNPRDFVRASVISNSPDYTAERMRYTTDWSPLYLIGFYHSTRQVSERASKDQNTVVGHWWYGLQRFSQAVRSDKWTTTWQFRHCSDV